MKSLALVVLFSLISSQAFARSVSMVSTGDDWFFESNACNEAKDNARSEVVRELTKECALMNQSLVKYEISNDCVCEEHDNQPKYTCEIESLGECQ